jgi:probable rRNA maturation factor
VLDVEVFGGELAPDGPDGEEVRDLCERAASSLGVRDGHVAVEFVGPERIAELNARHRGRTGPTDVLSFPVDGAAPGRGGEPRELGDIVVCPPHASDLREAVLHGMLHLLGMDHETDEGQMLALQDRLMGGTAP